MPLWGWKATSVKAPPATRWPFTIARSLTQPLTYGSFQPETI